MLAIGNPLFYQENDILTQDSIIVMTKFKLMMKRLKVYQRSLRNHLPKNAEYMKDIARFLA